MGANIELRLEVNIAKFNATMYEYERKTGVDIGVIMDQAASGVARRVMGITPPAKGERGRDGRLTKDDHKRGLASVGSDLDRLFAPVKLARNSGRKEEWPDVKGLHASTFANKRMGKPLRNPLGFGKKYYVDERKFNALQKELRARVGRMAAGWLAACVKFKATGVPAWVSTHGVGGGANAPIIRQNYKGFIMTNTHVEREFAPEMDRRFGYAIEYQRKAIVSQMQRMIRQNRTASKAP